MPGGEVGVGRGGGAMHDHLQLGQDRARGFERRDHAVGLVVHGRRHLRQAHRCVIGVEHDEVGEGAADIDACDPA